MLHFPVFFSIWMEWKTCNISYYCNHVTRKSFNHFIYILVLCNWTSDSFCANTLKLIFSRQCTFFYTLYLNVFLYIIIKKIVFLRLFISLMNISVAEKIKIGNYIKIALNLSLYSYFFSSKLNEIIYFYFRSSVLII